MEYLSFIFKMISMINTPKGSYKFMYISLFCVGIFSFTVIMLDLVCRFCVAYICNILFKRTYKYRQAN